MLVVDQVENSSNQISLADAQRANPGAQVGDTIADTLPPLEYGRIAAQSAKQVIVQKVREAERDRQYQEFKDRIGDIVNGVVKRVEYGSVIVDLGRGEAIIRRDEMLPREVFRNGDRVRAYIFDVRRETRGPQIFLSRTHPQFMAKLFAQEVPEIYDGIVEIKAVARDPGSRAKIGGDFAGFLGRSGRRLRRHARLARAGRGQRTAGREDRHHSVVARHRDLRRQRAGARRSRQGRDRRGPRAHRGRGSRHQQPAVAGDRPPRPERPPRLAAHRLGHRHPHRAGRIRAPPGRLRELAPGCSWKRSNVDEVVGQLLASEGFTSVEELALVDAKELAGIEGFDEETANELQSRAREYLEQLETELENKRKELGVDDALKTVPGVTSKMLVKFGENDIKSVEDLAGCATDDLVGWTERKEGGEPTKFPAFSTPTRSRATMPSA